MNEEQKQALDATADERGATLGRPHVADGAQPYHADALTPAEPLNDAAKENEAANG